MNFCVKYEYFCDNFRKNSFTQQLTLDFCAAVELSQKLRFTNEFV